MRVMNKAGMMLSTKVPVKANPADKTIIKGTSVAGNKVIGDDAINLSLGESIILQPITPAALQPNPCTW